MREEPERYKNAGRCLWEQDKDRRGTEVEDRARMFVWLNIGIHNNTQRLSIRGYLKKSQV